MNDIRINGASNGGANWGMAQAYHTDSVKARKEVSGLENVSGVKNSASIKALDKVYGGLVENKVLKNYTENVVGGKDVSVEKKLSGLEVYTEKVVDQYANSKNGEKGKELSELEKALGSEIKNKDDLKTALIAMAEQAGVLGYVATGSSETLADMFGASDYGKTGAVVNYSA
ncbi:MAG: hypothetical protein V1888_00495 [archaeon]